MRHTPHKSLFSSQSLKIQVIKTQLKKVQPKKVIFLSLLFWMQIDLLLPISLSNCLPIVTVVNLFLLRLKKLAVLLNQRYHTYKTISKSRWTAPRLTRSQIQLKSWIDVNKTFDLSWLARPKGDKSIMMNKD